ncbi:ribose-phosphate pyrophosphokinase [Anaplasmataceae bacterium AB001_6]|nr:ribose-phosphate pyrophosphokinase [Anaplasmataceae bacterium AB001_6]
MHVFLGNNNDVLINNIVASYENSDEFKNYLTVQKVLHKQFADGENYTRLDDQFVYNEDVTLLETLSNDSAVINLMLMIDAVSRLRPRSLNIFIPYMGYARQDRVNASGEAISVAVLFRMLSEYYPVRNFNFIDIHNPNSLTILRNCQVNNLNLSELFIKEIRKSIGKDGVVVAPDFGSIKRSRDLAKQLSFPVALIEKQRDLSSGDVDMISIRGDIKGRNCIIYDDMVDSAGTLCKAADMLKKNGAKKIFACLTHGIFSGQACESIQNSSLEGVFVTNTRDCSIAVAKCSKIKLLDVSSFILNSIIRYL